MSKNVNRVFSCSIDEIEKAAVIIQAALKSDLQGPDVVARMAPTFQTDFDALVAALATAVDRQDGAKGTVHTVAADQTSTIEETGLYVSTAREIAKQVFKSNKPVQHDEFAVGKHSPRSIAAIMGRAEQVHAACVKYAEPMAGSGWQATDTTKLGELIDALEAAQVGRSGAGSSQKGTTSGVVSLANAVYQQIRLVQIAANIVYPESKIARDPSIVEARGKYLLGVFPPRESAGAEEPVTPPATPGTTTPATSSAS